MQGEQNKGVIALHEKRITNAIKNNKTQEFKLGDLNPFKENTNDLKTMYEDKFKEAHINLNVFQSHQTIGNMSTYIDSLNELLDIANKLHKKNDNGWLDSTMKGCLKYFHEVMTIESMDIKPGKKPYRLMELVKAYGEVVDKFNKLASRYGVNTIEMTGERYGDESSGGEEEPSMFRRKRRVNYGDESSGGEEEPSMFRRKRRVNYGGSGEEESYHALDTRKNSYDRV